MRKQNVDGAVGLLQAEAGRLEARLEALNTEAAGVQASLDKVRGALAALETGGLDPASARASATKAPKVREPGKTGLTDLEVRELVLAALESGEKTEAELKALVLQHVKATGRLGTGVHLTLARVLRGNEVEKAPGGYRAKRAESA